MDRRTFVKISGSLAAQAAVLPVLEAAPQSRLTAPEKALGNPFLLVVGVKSRRDPCPIRLASCSPGSPSACEIHVSRTCQISSCGLDRAGGVI